MTTARKLNPAPIPLHEDALDDATIAIAQRIAQFIFANYRPNQPLGDLYRQNVRILDADIPRLGRNVKTGKAIDVRLIVTARPSSYDLFASEGAVVIMSDHSMAAMVYLNGSKMAGEFIQPGAGGIAVEAAFLHQLRSTLAHEVRHLSQFVRPGKSHDISLSEMEDEHLDDVSRKRLWRRYVNDVHEMESRIGDIVGEVYTALNGRFGDMIESGKLNSPQQAMDIFLKHSYTWQSLGRDLNRRNRERMLRATYQAMAPALEEIEEQ